MSVEMAMSAPDEPFAGPPVNRFVWRTEGGEPADISTAADLSLREVLHQAMEGYADAETDEEMSAIQAALSEWVTNYIGREVHRQLQRIPSATVTVGGEEFRLSTDSETLRFLGAVTKKFGSLA